MATLKTKLLLRNDTTAKWSASNPVLSKGEMGVEWVISGATGVEGKCKLKLGDGYTDWNNLDYIGGDTVKIVTNGSGNTVVGLSSSEDNGITTYTLTLGNRVIGSQTTTTALGNDDTTVPTSKAVKDAIATQVAGAVQYLGTISAVANLSTAAGKGDFYRASADVENVWHAGDLIIAEKNNPTASVDGTNWSVVHGEDVGIVELEAGTGITIDSTNSEKPKVSVKLKDSTVQSVAAAAVSANANRTYAIQVNANNQLVVNVPWSAGTDSRDPGYGHITPANSEAVTALTGNTTKISAGTFSENVNFSAANKWIVLAGTSGSENGKDAIKWGHALTGLGSVSKGPTANVTQTARTSKEINIPAITIDEAGHVTALSSYKLTVIDTDTHYTTGLYIGATNAKSNAATTNGNTYLKLYDNDAKRAEFNIKGTGATTVVSDASGNITINSTNTTYGIVSNTADGLAPKMTTNNSFLMRVGSATTPTWNSLVVLDGGSASTTEWGTITA